MLLHTSAICALPESSLLFPLPPPLQLRVLIKIEILFGFYVQTFCTLSFGSHNGGTLHSLRVNLCVNFPNEPEANPFWGVATGVARRMKRGLGIGACRASRARN